MTTSQSGSIIVKVASFAPTLEKIMLAGLVAGAIYSSRSTVVMSVAMLGLAVAFFLSAYRPIQGHLAGENEPLEFKHLLAWMILPKVLWISSAVSAFGLSIYLFHTNNDGHLQMFLIGATTIGAAIFMLAMLALTGVKYLRSVVPVLFRAIPLLIIDCYLLWGKVSM